MTLATRLRHLLHTRMRCLSTTHIAIVMSCVFLHGGGGMILMYDVKLKHFKIFCEDFVVMLGKVGVGTIMCEIL